MSIEAVQVDPAGCGCTECITGLYVPLEMASRGQIYLAAVGMLGNATGLTSPELQDRMRNARH